MSIAARANSDQPTLGIIMMLVAYLFFAMLDTTVKWLAIAGLPALQIAFVRYAGHFVISFGSVSRGGFSLDRFATERFGLVLLRSLLLAASTGLNFMALRYLPLTVTSAIMFSAPVLVCLLSWPLLGEKVGPWRAFAIMLGFLGVLIVIRPFGETFHWAAILSVINTLALALYSILTRKLSGIVATQTLQLYAGVVGTLVFLPFAIAEWQNPAGVTDWLLLAALGIWGWSGHELMTRAHGFAPASALMPYTYSFIIYLTISSYLVFNTLPDQWTLAGAAIIVVSGLIIWKRSQIREIPHEVRVYR